MASDPPRVSVVLPFRDAEAYLEQAITSIARQTFREFECLLIEDGSSDRSASIARGWEHRDSRFRVIDTGGIRLTASLNLGLAEARGEYAARMDGDDIAMPHRLQRQVRFMDRHRDVIASGTAVLLIDEDGLPMFVRRFARAHEAIDAQLMRGVGGIAHPTAILRLHDAPAPIGYREDYPVAQDRELWLRLAEAGRLANLPDPLLAYRQHPTAVAATRSEEQARFTRQAIDEASKRRGLANAVDRMQPRETRAGMPWVNWCRRSLMCGHLRAAARLATREAARVEAPPLDVRLLARLSRRWTTLSLLERMAAPPLTWLDGVLRRS